MGETRGGDRHSDRTGGSDDSGNNGERGGDVGVQVGLGTGRGPGVGLGTEAWARSRRVGKEQSWQLAGPPKALHRDIVGSGQEWTVGLEWGWAASSPVW